VPLSVTQAAMGAEIRVPTLEGDQGLKIPEGTQPGHHISHPQQGRARAQWTRQRRSIRGSAGADSTKLSKRQKELLEELESTVQVDNQPLMRSLLGKVKDMFG
jgi:molecular chaperone DnaJ